jgi:hypothetical protein
MNARVAWVAAVMVLAVLSVIAQAGIDAPSVPTTMFTDEPQG